MVKCRKWVLRSHFSGLPKREDLEIVEEELPPLKDGRESKSIDPPLANLKRRSMQSQWAASPDNLWAPLILRTDHVTGHPLYN